MPPSLPLNELFIYILKEVQCGIFKKKKEGGEKNMNNASLFVIQFDREIYNEGRQKRVVLQSGKANHLWKYVLLSNPIPPKQNKLHLAEKLVQDVIICWVNILQAWAALA